MTEYVDKEGIIALSPEVICYERGEERDAGVKEKGRIREGAEGDGMEE